LFDSNGNKIKGKRMSIKYARFVERQEARKKKILQKKQNNET
jgi:hypothetical protein